MKFPRTELIPVLTTMMLLGRTGVSSAQDTYTGVSCVQVSSSNFSTTCPCGVTPFSFSIVGETSVVDLVVNLAVVLDGSGSVGSTNFLTEKEFAKNITAAFAERNLFDNGGTASYVQFNSYVDADDTGTFYSLEDFNGFVDNNEYNSGGTDIDDGIAAARELLNAAPSASAAYMIVLTDGISTIGTEANDSRADGISLFAVGVGSSVSDDILLEIAGGENNVFSVDEFDDLEAVVGDILDNGTTTTVSCPATNVTLTVEFGTTVDSVVSDPEATISSDTVTFLVSDLEDNPTYFKVVLDTCGATEPVDPVLSITYSDDQGNSPNFTELLDIKSDSTCPPATSPPTLSPTLSSTPSSTSSTTPSSTLSPTLSSTLSPTLSSTPSPTSSTTPSSTLSPTLSSTTSPTLSSTPSPTSSTTPSSTPAPTSSSTPFPTSSTTPFSTLSPILPSTPSPTSSPTTSPTSSSAPSSTPSSAPSSTPKPDCNSDKKTNKNKRSKRSKRSKRGKGPKGKGHRGV